MRIGILAEIRNCEQKFLEIQLGLGRPFLHGFAQNAPQFLLHRHTLLGRPQLELENDFSFDVSDDQLGHDLECYH